MASGRWAVFLRGVNLGGRRLSMRDLAAFVAELGARDVRTYLQSGNVAFRASAAEARVVAAELEARGEARFGFPLRAVLRGGDELQRVLAENPFLAAGADDGTLHVAFLADVPAAEALARLDPQRSPPDAFAVRGREIYLQLPGGVARSKLSNAYFDGVLGTVSTARNWRTVRAMAELTAG
ncbi:MAG: DUF1697 domain-containing protein [Deinococcales bacterium]